MKKSKLYLILIPLLMNFLLHCKGKEEVSFAFIAEIVGFDSNCATCYLKFSEVDKPLIEQLIGKSKNEIYNAVNLVSDEYAINDKVHVEIRKASTIEIPACITLYPSIDYQEIYVISVIKK